MQRSKKRKLQKPIGKCWETCARFVDQHPGEGLKLVHGSVFAQNLGRRIEHAWIEIPAGNTIENDTGNRETLTTPAVYDPTAHRKKMRLLSKALFVRLTKAEWTSHWWAWQIPKQIARYQSFGPWPADPLGWLDGPPQHDIVVAEATSEPESPGSQPRRRGEPT